MQVLSCLKGHFRYRTDNHFMTKQIICLLWNLRGSSTLTQANLDKHVISLIHTHFLTDSIGRQHKHASRINRKSSPGNCLSALLTLSSENMSKHKCHNSEKHTVMTFDKMR